MAINAHFTQLLEKVCDLLVANFAVTMENEFRLLGEMTGSSYANVMRAQGVPMAQAAKHTAGTIARL